MRSTLCSVVLALSGCAACPLAYTPRSTARDSPKPGVVYTESAHSLIALEDLYISVRTLHVLLDRPVVTSSGDIARATAELRTWTQSLGHCISRRLEHSTLAGAGWQISLGFIKRLDSAARHSARSALDSGPVHTDPYLKSIVSLTYDYVESSPDSGWLIQHDSRLSDLLVEQDYWQEQ